MNEEKIMIEAQELVHKAYLCGYRDSEGKKLEAYEDVKQKLIEQGRNEAWEAARTIIDFWFNVADCDPNNFAKLFGIDAHLGDDVFEKLFEQFSASEAIEKLRAYEEQKKQEGDSKIRVGDEVVNNNGDKGIVLCYYHETDSYGNYKKEWLVVYMPNYDVPQTVTKKRFKKTGKHYDVMSILKKMKEGE